MHNRGSVGENMEFKSGNLIVTKASDAGLDTNAIKALMIARGIDPKEITPEEVAERFVRLVASTEDVDGIGDVVKSNGWDFTTWLTNPAMFADHRQTLDHTIARGLQAYVDTATKTAVIDAFFVPERYDKFGIAEFCYQLYKSGLAKGVSVGAVPTEMHWATKADVDLYGDKVRRIWDKSQLLELSFVGIPMNASALVGVVAKSLAEKKIDSEMFDRMATCDSAPWSMFAKAAMYERKSFEVPVVAPVVDPSPVEPVVPVLAPEIKSMIDAMAKTLSEQATLVQSLTTSAAEQKKANTAILKRLEMKDDGDILHISSADLQSALSYLAAAAEILGTRLPPLGDDPDDDPSHTEADAVNLGKVDDCNGTATTKSSKSKSEDGKGLDVAEMQRLIDLAQTSQHTTTKKEA
jgi:hypothetical protein